ncbi:MAG: hypothetical protein BroJett030_22420 [Alphaproteobacteria bacterium]|nr:MAG: hypothetical protein BroJett030_22420 [Alphaproteobacteria bacterium]
MAHQRPFSPCRLAAQVAVVFAGLALAACNSDSFSDSLKPRANVAPTAQVAPQPAAELGEQAPASDPSVAPSAMADTARPSPAQQQVASQQQATSQQQVAALPRVDPVAFLPVTGAPQSIVTRLAGSMRSAAQAQSVPVVVSVDRGARYQVKGYFSALGDGSGTTLVYVWDILDRNGVRVHRISGQERGPAASGDPWNSVTSDMIDRVAQSTVGSLRTWMSSSRSG